MKKTNSVWAFFASVKLALSVLFVLAVTSIIGTVIPQKETAQWYTQSYGENMANLIEVLSFRDMYNSWWFIPLLLLLSLNLIICSIDRFPNVWKIIKADNLEITIERLKKMRFTSDWEISSSPKDVASNLTTALANNGWKSTSCEKENGILLFTQKGGWTRTGVYMVHASILFIFLGALIGSVLGFKGSVMIPETRSSGKVYAFEDSKPIDLGFEIRCNTFDIEFYPNGMPKEYKSSLTVIEDGKEILTKDIEVNGPLTYKGITFYQSSYNGYQDFIVEIVDKKTKKGANIITPFQKQQSWDDGGIRFVIINAEVQGQSVSRIKVWFTDEDGEPSVFWINNKGRATVQRNSGDYTVSARQMYGTGLQVTKDPGVWWVYFGCGLMLFGLGVAFFMSHKRIWFYISEDDGKTTVLMTGGANKNKVGFAKEFNELKSTVCKL